MTTSRKRRTVDLPMVAAMGRYRSIVRELNEVTKELQSNNVKIETGYRYLHRPKTCLLEFKIKGDLVGSACTSDRRIELYADIHHVMFSVLYRNMPELEDMRLNEYESISDDTLKLRVSIMIRYYERIWISELPHKW